MAAPGGAPGAVPGVPVADLGPQTPADRVKFLFEKYILNFVYNQNEKHEWRVMMAGMFGAVTVAAAVLSVYPIMDRVDEKLTIEAVGRSLLLARQMVDRNGPFLLEHQESRIYIEFVTREPNVTNSMLMRRSSRWRRSTRSSTSSTRLCSARPRRGRSRWEVAAAATRFSTR
jgi:hypothetical protein